MKYTPTKGRVVITTQSETKTDSGLFVQSKKNQGEVVAAHKDSELKVGQRIIFESVDFVYLEPEIIVILEEEILVIINDNA